MVNTIGIILLSVAKDLYTGTRLAALIRQWIEEGKMKSDWEIFNVQMS